MTKDISKVGNLDIKIDYEKVIDEFAEKCKDKVVANARSKIKSHRGRYISGWTTTAEENKRGGYTVTVHNATDWQLAHLLENGHIIANKRGGTGWASARPHIAPAYRSLRNKFVKAMSQVELDIKV